MALHVAPRVGKMSRPGGLLLLKVEFQLLFTTLFFLLVSHVITDHFGVQADRINQ